MIKARGWKAKGLITIHSAGIGWDAKARRYVLPVADLATGEVVDLRLYAPDVAPGANKMMHRKGGTARLYAPGGFDAGESVVLCEGEWDALVARERGFNAVGTTGGAGTVPRLEFLEPLRGCTVILAFDCDDAGRIGADKWARRLTEDLGCAVAIADLGLGDKEDVSDWFVKYGKSAKKFRKKLDAAVPWAVVGEGYEEILAAVRAEFLVELETATDHLVGLMNDEDVAALPAIPYIIDGWLPTGTYGVLFGEPGVMKTFLLLSMSRAVRRGTRWQDNKTDKGAVLFYQGEGVRQFKDRSAAWDERYPLREDQSMAPVYYKDGNFDLTKPEQVASAINTVRMLEETSGVAMKLLVIDPLVEFMTGDENGEGMELASRGLRALARLLDCAVVVGHHTNASGERERGAAHLRQRAGTFIRMEWLDEGAGRVGLFQHKQRNSEKLALILELRKVGASLVLEWIDNTDAQEYVRAKEGDRRKTKEAGNERERDKRMRDIRVALRKAKKPLNMTALIGEVGGDPTRLGALLREMEESGVVVKEDLGDGRSKFFSLTPDWEHEGPRG